MVDSIDKSLPNTVEEIKDEEFHRLEDRVREYENGITLDKRDQTNLLLQLEQMKHKIETKDNKDHSNSFQRILL